ncbi:hypothetical protein QDQ39_00725 [Providencia rettgeri]|uniref:hypothetical protein n=1 Tax=Providencia TaxID=586 RepID=UPI002449C65F|nr:hypothetical protein [Providencia rettgeri]MDH2394328.1 hypothetical protein [Providencia rettgeri]
MSQEEKVTTDANSKRQYRYCGKVFGHPYFLNLCDQFPEVDAVYKSFIDYWRNGLHPAFGRDRVFNRPEVAREYHIRHVHVDVKDYKQENDSDYTSRESHWDAWKNMIAANDPAAEQLLPRSYFRAPTSDAFLVYSVNEYRDAIVLDFIQADAHRLSERTDLTDFYTQEVFKYTINNGIKPFHTDGQPFDEKHLNNNQNPS